MISKSDVQSEILAECVRRAEAAERQCAEEVSRARSSEAECTKLMEEAKKGYTEELERVHDEQERLLNSESTLCQQLIADRERSERREEELQEQLAVLERERCEALASTRLLLDD